MVLDAGNVLRPYEDRDCASLLAILGRADLTNLALRERFFFNEAEFNTRKCSTEIFTRPRSYKWLTV